MPTTIDLAVSSIPDDDIHRLLSLLFGDEEQTSVEEVAA